MTHNKRIAKRISEAFLNIWFLGFIFWIAIIILITKSRISFTTGEFVIALLVSVLGVHISNKFWRDSYDTKE